MNNKLFETGKIEFPPAKVMAEILLRARKELRKSEDDWTLDEMLKVRDMFPLGFKSIDPSMLAVRLRRLRKDKVVPKVKKPKQLVDKFKKLLRDFEKSRTRRGNSHLSKEYIEYVVDQSPEWVLKAKEHKERCNYRCQLCGEQSSKLEVHHTTEGYRNLRYEKPWHLLAVCKAPCHPIADMLRSGWLLERGHDESGFFSEDDIPE